MNNQGRSSSMTRTMLSVCLSVSLSACAVTQQGPLKGSAGGSGLVDYSMRSSGAAWQAASPSINPAAQWTRYRKILIEPVTYWADHGDTKIPPSDQRALCNYFQQTLQQQFSKYFS